MLKVYGVTYEHITNYGSCFQAYALQTAIDSLVVHEDVCSYHLIPLRKLDGYPKIEIKHVFGKILDELWRLSFRSFDKKMKYAPIHSMNQLYETGGEEADAYVCGSDVIWNPDLNNGITAYYLDFAKKYAFSYAASFGKTDIDRNKLNEIGKYISRLDQISVREESSKAIAESILENTVEVVGDPVILLSKEEWSRNTPRTHAGKKYIFVYTTHFNPVLESFIKKLKEQTNCRVVRSAWGRSKKTVLKQGVLILQSPERWLQLLRDADYVITNSFHATVFSVLFHKRFFTIVRGDKARGSNIRINDFLHSIGLEDRLFSDVPNDIILDEIDYFSADRIISELKDKSIAFLQKNLDASNKNRSSQKQCQMHE